MGVVIYNRSGDYTGYLGNVMFQTAACIGIAEKNGMQYYNPYKPYFDYFKGDFSNLSNNSIMRYITPIPREEKNYHYDECVLNTNEIYNLTGYFQSKKYWAHCEDKIRSIFTFKDSTVNAVKDRYKEILSLNPVSIHLRRGDFAKWPKAHPMLPLEYYNKAIALFPKGTHFLVFSNDIPYCEKHFIASNFTIVKDQNEAEDMCLMSMCDGGHIIANSSFSIWATYLSGSKKVVAPHRSKYYGETYAHWNLKDLYEPHWTEVNF